MVKKKLGLGGGLGQFRQEVKDLTVLPELKAFIPPLTKDERALLVDSIKADGVKEPIDVWANEDKHVVVDGHNRYEIAQELKVSFEIKEHRFNAIEEVKDWMLKKQLGRRNLTDANRTYLIGLLYNKSKSEKGKHERSDQSNEKGNVAEQIASQTGTSPRTVKSAGDFAQGLDKLSPELKQHVLSGEKKVPKAKVQDLAAAQPKKPIQSVEQLDKELVKAKENKQKPKRANLKPVSELKDEVEHKGAEVVEKTKESPQTTGGDALLSDDDYLERYAQVKKSFNEHFSREDEAIVFSVMHDMLELRSNLSDHVKLINDGYTILRCADTPTVHIKHFSHDRNSWRTLENGFKSKAERDRRFKELLEDSKTIRG